MAHRLPNAGDYGLLLTLAAIDPMDINALDAIEVHTNIEVEAAIWTAMCSLGMLATGAAPDCAEQRELLAASTSHLDRKSVV